MRSLWNLSKLLILEVRVLMGDAKCGIGISSTEMIQDLDRLKLLIAFDAILVEGSLGRAAEKLGKTPPAMSRILRQLRDHYGQELFERTGKGMVPTSFAENLRPRIRALVTEANSLLTHTQDCRSRDPLLIQPPLALNQWRDAGSGPNALEIAHRLAVSGDDEDPARRFAAYIATIGNASGQTRPLNEPEAEDAFGILLSEQLADVQIGAFLIALQSRGLTDQELAGFTRAARRHSQLKKPGTGPAELDWPAYLSPRAQGMPLFIHSARLVSRAGYRIMMHGFEDGIVQRAFKHARLPVALSLGAEVFEAIQGGIAFLPIERFAPDLRRLLWLYPLFMMPNVTHFLVPMLNPGAAGVTLTGLRPGGRAMLQPDAAARLGWGTYAVLSGHRDAAQTIPGKGQNLFMLHDGRLANKRLIGPVPETSRRKDTIAEFNRMETWQAIWDGVVTPPDAIASIIETAALALNLLLGPTETMEQSREKAKELWSARRK